MEDPLPRKLAAILHADVAGYSRLAGADEDATHRQLRSALATIGNLVTSYNGRIANTAGDAVLAVFDAVVDAVACALAIQAKTADLQAHSDDDEPFLFRIGINLGDIIEEGGDIFGDGVNVAARLESLADPGGICISETVHTALGSKLPVDFTSLGQRNFKNIADPVGAYSVELQPDTALPEPHGRTTSPGDKQRKVLSIAVALIVAIAVGGYFAWNAREKPADTEAISSAVPLPDNPSVAVLPFDNMSADPEQEYFVDGMTEDLITDLSKIPGLFVIARNSSFTYKNQTVDIKQVASELGVRYVLEGSVRRVGNQVRINAQLIDAATNGHIWAERYDGEMENVFEVQDKITANIVGAMELTLTDGPALPTHVTENIHAHDAYLKGWAYFKLGDIENLAKSIPHFEEAIALDPGHALAQAALATVYWDAFADEWTFEIKTPSFMAESLADEHLAEAMKNPTPLAHALQSKISIYFSDLDGAVAEAKKAVDLDINDATSQAALANVQFLDGDYDDALLSIEKAMRLDPHYPPQYLSLKGALEFALGKYEDAITTLNRAIRQGPEDEFPRITLAAALVQSGKLEEAEDVIEHTNDLRSRLRIGGALSLERADLMGFSPFTGEIDFGRYGQVALQEKLRENLTQLKILTWQYLVSYPTTVITPDSETGEIRIDYEIEGATQIELDRAKILYEQGARFIDTGFLDNFNKFHVNGAIHLPLDYDPERPNATRLKEATITQHVNRDEPVVLYACLWARQSCIPSSWEAAKTVRWGYEKVYWLEERSVDLWVNAGIPIAGSEAARFTEN